MRSRPGLASPSGRASSTLELKLERGYSSPLRAMPCSASPSGPHGRRSQRKQKLWRTSRSGRRCPGQVRDSVDDRPRSAGSRRLVSGAKAAWVPLLGGNSTQAWSTQRSTSLLGCTRAKIHPSEGAVPQTTPTSPRRSSTSRVPRPCARLAGEFPRRSPSSLRLRARRLLHTEHPARGPQDRWRSGLGCRRPNRPPLLDFLHLWHMGRHKIGDLEWGPSIVSDLLPWAREGGDDVVRSLAQRIDVDVSPSKLEALVSPTGLPGRVPAEPVR